MKQKSYHEQIFPMIYIFRPLYVSWTIDMNNKDSLNSYNEEMLFKQHNSAVTIFTTPTPKTFLHNKDVLKKNEQTFIFFLPSWYSWEKNKNPPAKVFTKEKEKENKNKIPEIVVACLEYFMKIKIRHCW